MVMEPEHRSQVEHALQRPLTDEELVVVADLAALPPSHLDVIERLYTRSLIAALLYLRAVTNDISPSRLRNFVHGFDSFIAQRDKRPVWIAQPHYERELGRTLTADEMVCATSLQSITRAQREVARALAVNDRPLALAYLRNLVQYSSSEERQAFLDSLPGAE
jgi:hypothetical protein